MGKRVILGLILSVFIMGNGIIVHAEPKTMPDGMVFDAEYYADTYPDVKAAYGNDEVALYNHYLAFGKAEGRKATSDTNGNIPAEFDAKYYAEKNPDVVAVYGKDASALYKHYVEYGKKEGRKCRADEKVANTTSTEVFADPSIAVGNGTFKLTAIINTDPANQQRYAPDVTYIGKSDSILREGTTVSSKYLYGQWTNETNTLTYHAMWDISDYDYKTKVNGLYKYGDIDAYQIIDNDTYVLRTKNGGGFRVEIYKGEGYIYGMPIKWMTSAYSNFSDSNWICF